MASVELIPVTRQPRVFGQFSRMNHHDTFLDPVTKARFFQTWKPPVIEPSISDLTFIVTSDVEFRPDLISYRFYQTPLLSWVICHVNNIFHPWDRVEGVVVGRTLRIPNPTNVYSVIL